MPIILPNPCKQEVLRYLQKWNEMENYRLQEEALDKLFLSLAPENKNIYDILIKASALNDFYSTNIYSIFTVAKHIRSLHIDKRLQGGDVSLVPEMQRVVVGGKEKNFYSFSTKYCSHHNPDAFPMYDSYVDKMLIYFRDREDTKFASFANKKLKDYTRFKAVLEQFREYFGLQEFTLNKSISIFGNWEKNISQTNTDFILMDGFTQPFFLYMYINLMLCCMLHRLINNHEYCKNWK